MSIDPISSKKALETLSGIEHLEPERAEASRKALDAAELREVETPSIGMHAHAPERPTRLLERVVRRFRGS